MWFLSLPVPSQSAVVTTTGKPLEGTESADVLNLSHSSNVSNISNLMPPEILNQEIDGASDAFKDMVNEELKNIELAEQMEKKKEQEKIRIAAHEKAVLLWHKKKEIEKANAEAECKKTGTIKN